jgi:RNA polymerase sigma-70 factor (ECF subfamily)
MRVSAIDRNPEAVKDGLKAALLEHRPALLRYLAARRVPPYEAEDLFQDLFMKLETHPPPGPVAETRAYLYRMAENLLLDRRRSEGRRRGREEVWTAGQAGAMPDADDRPSAEAVLIARDRLSAISAALAALPQRTLFIFRRYRIEAIAQSGIAAELGISLSAVEKHLQKAYRVVAAARAQLDADAAVPRRPSGESEP